MKKGFDVHDFNHRMELALAGLRENKKVSLHNRLKILEFLDYLETQGVGLPRRIRYVLQIGKFAAMLPMDFEKATRKDIEAVLLKYGRLNLEDETKAAFKIMLRRFYRWLKAPQDEQYPPEVSWIKTSVQNGRIRTITLTAGAHRSIAWMNNAATPLISQRDNQSSLSSA